MFKVIGLFALYTCALASPLPSLAGQQSNTNAVKPKNLNAVTVEQDASQAVGKDSFLTSGSAKRLDIDGESRLVFNEHDNFIPLFRPPTGEAFHRPEQLDEDIDAEVAAARAIETPLFFDTFEHSHMVTNYAERRQAPLLFRSIRPDFPWSDIQTGRRAGN